MGTKSSMTDPLEHVLRDRLLSKVAIEFIVACSFYGEIAGLPFRHCCRNNYVLPVCVRSCLAPRGFMLLLWRTAGAYASWLGEFEGC
jgi:hypothetical protein